MGRLEKTILMTTSEDVFVRGRLSPAQLEWLRQFFALCFRLLTRVEATGLENIPPTGGLMLTPNHLSRFDAPLTFIHLPHRRFTVFNADTYRQRWFFRNIMESVDVIWVNRGATHPSAVKAAIRAINEGSILGVAPEGTRSATQALQVGKPGAAFFALMSGATILPVGLVGTEKVGAALKRFQRITVGIHFGRPYTLTAVPGQRERPTPERLESATHEIMCRIAALVPPEYRGAYTEAPRVQELLAQAAEPKKG